MGSIGQNASAPVELSDSVEVVGSRTGLDSTQSLSPADIVPGSSGGAVDSNPVADHSHTDLCPLGGAATRWYLCVRHGAGLVFCAGSGRVDSVANSCPLCGHLSGPFAGCACEYARNLLDRSARPGRRVRSRRELPELA